MDAGMKKLFLLLLAVVVVASALGVQVGTVYAKEKSPITYEDGVWSWGAGIVFTFDATGYRNKDVKNASIYVGSDFYDLYCWIHQDGERILCVARGALTEFAGETGIIYLAGRIFYVIIPGKPVGNTTLTCGEFQMAGADVSFELSGGGFITGFVGGASLSEVSSNAANIVSSSAGFYIDYAVEGGLYCNFIES